MQGEHSLLGAVAGASREYGHTSDRVKRTKRASAREGYWAGMIRAYGYERVPVVDERGVVTRHSGLAPVPEEAAVVREMVARIFAGETLSQVACDLNAAVFRRLASGNSDPTEDRPRGLIGSAGSGQERGGAARPQGRSRA